MHDHRKRGCPITAGSSLTAHSFRKLAARGPANIYNQAMRRIVALAIAVLIVLPAITPLFALGGVDDASLPACCRKGGKHHCMVADMEGGASSSVGTSMTGTRMTGLRMTSATVSERCPYGSMSVPGAAHPDWTLQTAAAVFAGIVAHPSVAPQTESKRRIAADRSRHKRGPPKENS